MSPEERKQKIKLYGKGFEMLTEALEDAPRKMWQFKPSPTDWSIQEVLVHLADSESNAALRARLLIAEPGRPVMAYDQEAWAVKLNYPAQDVDDALKMVKLVRKTTHALLKTLPDETFENTILHPEYEKPYTFTMWLMVYSEHIPGHIEQIKQICAAWKAAGKGK